MTHLGFFGLGGFFWPKFSPSPYGLKRFVRIDTHAKV